ncbi:MAG: carbohydrate ABC transporter permease [Christensenellales bacterium]|jgi:raffinose/stachyose/melibiose transport system permease protein
MKIRRWFKSVAEIITIVFAVIYIMPVLIVLFNTLKPLGNILRNPFSLPKTLYLDNITYVLDTMNYLQVLWNTVIIAIIVVVMTILFSSMTGWMLARDGSRISQIIMALFVSSLMAPFQTFMIPLNNLINRLGISDSILGYVWVQVTLYAPMGVFMYSGFVKTVPTSLEESARLDGASTRQVFLHIVFPLMKPITASIAVLFSLWIWNDYLLAALMLKSVSKKTVTISVYSYFSMYNNRWDYAITAAAFSVIPISTLYVFLQKYIIAGVVAGAIKG